MKRVFLLFTVFFWGVGASMAQTPSFVGAYSAEDGSGIIIAEDSGLYYVEKITQGNWLTGADEMTYLYYEKAGDVLYLTVGQGVDAYDAGFVLPTADGRTIYYADNHAFADMMDSLIEMQFDEPDSNGICEFRIVIKNQAGVISKCKKYVKDNSATSRMKSMINDYLDEARLLMERERQLTKDFFNNNQWILGAWMGETIHGTKYEYTITQDKVNVLSSPGIVDSWEPSFCLDEEIKHIAYLFPSEMGSEDFLKIDLDKRTVSSDFGGKLVKIENSSNNVGNNDIVEVIEEEAIPIQLVEDKPSFNGGDANEFSKWVNSKLVYPEKAKENGLQGRVTIQFTVERDGSISNVEVLRGVDSLLDKEAIRVISSSSGMWSPGKQNNQPVRVIYTFPVVFKLQ